MTMTEEKKLRHALARFETTRHSSVTIVSAETLENGNKKVFAKIRGFKQGYIFQGDKITSSWRCI